jgi:hypothetical protein
LGQDINSQGSTVKKLIPRAGRAHPHPSPTPEQGPHGRGSLCSLTHAIPPPLPQLAPHSRQPAVRFLQSTPSIMTGMSRTVVKRTKDAALEHVKKALRTNGSLLTRLEVGFVRTSCHILGINSEATMRVIVKRAKYKGVHQPRKVLESLQSQLEELAVRAEKHKRPTPTPAFNTRTMDSMGAHARSLAHLQSCVDGLRDAMEGGYSMGIKTARIAMGNAKADFKATIDRIAEASRWKRGVIEDWLSRGEVVCGTGLMEEAEEVLKKAEAREEAEARLRIMESQCEELAELAEQAGKQIPAEAEAELLIDLEEEIGQRKETVGDLGPALKETVLEELKGRVEQAIQDSVMMAQRGRRYVDNVKTRLEFISKYSESGSYKGVTGEGAAPGRWQTAAEELWEEDELEDEAEEPYGTGSESLLDIMRGFWHMKAPMTVAGRHLTGGTPVTRDSRRSGEPTERPITLQ